jgi:ABC-type lipoprotein release transport system permease subunit
VGVAGGRWLWRLVDRGVGTVFPPVLPVAPLAAAVVVVLVVANVVALLPARRAARLRPAQVLRSE